MASPRVFKPFPEFLKHKAKNYLEISRRGEYARISTSVTLLRRLRAQSISDCFGCFSPNAGSTSWLGDAGSATVFSNMKFTPVVEPMVQLVSTTLTSAQVKLEIAAANKDPELGGAANVARGLFEYWNGRHGYWDWTLRSQLAQMVCTSYGCFIRSFSEKDKKIKGLTAPNFGMEDMPVPGEYACKCGSNGPFIGEVEQQGEFSLTECPSCHQMAEVLKEPGESPMEVPTGEQDLKSDENKTCVVSPFEVRLDERYSQNGNISKVGWLDYHPLMSEEEMYAEFGDTFGPPSELSFAARWKHAMETGTVVYEKSQTSEDDSVKFWEVRNIYMRPDQYLTYKSPSHYEMKDSKGEVVFELEPGDMLADKCPEGFKFKITGEKLLPCFEQVNLCDEWDYSGLSPDPMSFWWRPLVKYIQLQDDANEMYTIDMQHRERNAQVGIIYKDEAFDADSFEHDLIPTKAGYLMEEPIGHYVQTFTTPPMNEAKTGLQMLLNEIVPNYGGYQPAAVGAPSPNEPYAAQLLQKQQALGQLAQAQQSQANAEVGWFKKQATMAQNWPPAKLEYIRTRLGEEWKEEDIEAFLGCDIERDLDIDVMQGSEIPTSIIEREVRTNNMLTQIASLSPEIVAMLPEGMLKEVTSQWLASNGMDIDIDNIESQSRLDTARYMVVKDAAQKSEGQDPLAVIEKVFSAPIMAILPREDHESSIEFWVDHQIAAQCDQTPESPLLVLCYGRLIQEHEEAQTGQKQQATMQEIEAQKPALEAQAAMEGGGEPDTSQQDAEIKATEIQSKEKIEGAKLEAENARTGAEMEENERQRVFDAEQAKLDREHEDKRSERELEHQKQTEESRLKAQKETAKMAAKNKPAKAGSAK